MGENGESPNCLMLSQFVVDEELKGDLAKQLKDAHHNMWQEGDVKSWFVYGPYSGGTKFSYRLADFLSNQYGDTVDSGHVLPGLGINYLLSFVATYFTTKNSIAIVEELTHQSSASLLGDMGFPVFSVPLNKDGLDTDAFERVIKNNYTHCGEPMKYAGVAYLMPTLHDPTGITYTEECCLKILRIAKQYNILIICNDSLVMLLNTKMNSCAPKRLFALQKRDIGDSKGHVVSIGNFSSLLSATLDFGWIEASFPQIKVLMECSETASGGGLAHYTQGIFIHLLKDAAFLQLFDEMKKKWRNNLVSAHQQVTALLPKICTCHLPMGGYYLWLDIEGVNAQDLLDKCSREYKVSFAPGIHFSKDPSRKSSLRLCVANLGKKRLQLAIDQIISTAKILSKEDS